MSDFTLNLRDKGPMEVHASQLIPTDLAEQAEELKFHTGIDPWHVDREGVTAGLWVLGHTRFSILALPTLSNLIVLEERGANQQHGLAIIHCDDWTHLCETAAAIRLR